MIVGIIPDSSSVETLLNNLSEADFDLSAMSVIMADVKTRNALAHDTGPLKGARVTTLAARLAGTGLSPEAAAHCRDAVAAGKVLVAMKVPPESVAAAREMLADYSAELVQE